MLNTTQINDNLEAAASCLQEVIALAAQSRQGILVPPGVARSTEYSVRQRLRKLECDAQKLREYITWVYAYTESIAQHGGKCYVLAL